jgi:hypothetical protein
LSRQFFASAEKIRVDTVRSPAETESSAVRKAFIPFEEVMADLAVRMRMR